MELVGNEGATACTLEMAIEQLATRGHQITDAALESGEGDEGELCATVLGLALQTACGLAYLHSKGIVHRFVARCFVASDKRH